MEEVTALPVTQHSLVDDEEVALVLVAREDPSAFGELYRRYLPRVYRYLYSRTQGVPGSEEDAADLTQQVFLKALNALPGYREKGLPFAAWLFRIARNVVTDAYRRRKSAVNLDSLPVLLRVEALQSTAEHDRQDPETIAIRHESIRQLHSLLSGLDPEKRELLVLRFAAGLTVREIAPVVGKSEVAVQKQISRTLRSLKEQFKEKYDE